MAELVEIKNYGNRTEVKILGIDISKALDHVSYSSPERPLGSCTMHLDISINTLICVLAELKPEDVEKAREILTPYAEEQMGLKRYIL